MATTIGTRVSCMPMNQPLRLYSVSMAGAPQMTILKYVAAKGRTTAEGWMMASAASRSGHCNTRKVPAMTRATVTERRSSRRTPPPSRAP